MSENIKLSKFQILNRDVIKYIAMFTMLLNHIAHIFIEPNSLLFTVMTDTGHFTAITMCYFLVEGYHYTHSKRNYCLRLLAFALISQIPFYLAFHGSGLNMLFTLLLCFLIVAAMNQISYAPARIIIVVLLMLCTAVCDWSLLAGIYTIMFVKWQNSRKKTALAYAIAALTFLYVSYISYSLSYSFPVSFLYSICSCLGIAASGIVILCFYNGRRAERGRTFSKWFFYIFYPAHLLVLVIIRHYTA